MAWQPGDRVWYEPEPGVRFAGTVVRHAAEPGRVIVQLIRHFSDWEWGRVMAYGSLPAAAPISSLTRRDEDYGDLEP